MVEDRALLFDTARFKYPPHWVSLPDLYKAIDTVDDVSQAKRGFIILARKNPVIDICTSE